MMEGIKFETQENQETGEIEMWATWFPRKLQAPITAVYSFNKRITDAESAKARLTWSLLDAVNEAFGNE